MKRQEMGRKRGGQTERNSREEEVEKVGDEDKDERGKRGIKEGEE